MIQNMSPKSTKGGQWKGTAKSTGSNLGHLVENTLWMYVLKVTCEQVLCWQNQCSPDNTFSPCLATFHITCPSTWHRCTFPRVVEMLRPDGLTGSHVRCFQLPSSISASVLAALRDHSWRGDKCYFGNHLLCKSSLLCAKLFGTSFEKKPDNIQTSFPSHRFTFPGV